MAKVKCSKCSFLNEAGAKRCHQCGTELPSISFEERPQSSPSGPPPAPQQDVLQFKRGQVINNRYTVLDMIGRGGMGCIYKVHDNVLGEDLALKTLLPQYVSEKTVIDRFLNEARITRRLTHPNIVRVHDIGTAGKGIFISMEYVRGDSLRALLERRTPGERIPVRQVLHIIDQLCVALDYAHQYTVHRDIKPENIMVTEGNQIKLMDFGISKLMDNRFVTSASMVMGTPYYMSPEQHRNTRDVDARADIYSVGVVMYELLTGNMPTGVPKPASQLLKEIPPALDEIVERCIDPNREKRFKTAGDLRRAILPIIEMLDEGKDIRKTLARKRLSPGDMRLPRLRFFLFGVAAMLALVAGALGLYAFERLNASGPGTRAVEVVNLSGGHGERFAELEFLVNAMQPHVASITGMGTPQREWADAGQERWNQAVTAAKQGDAGAVSLAEDALRHLMAAVMNPEGMVFVPGGHVTVEGVSVYEPAFFIDVSEVTMAQFDDFCKSVEEGWTPAPELADSMQAYPNHPVSYVAWFDAQAFAAWKGKQLPSRAQWERAAHGDANASPVYPWGAEWKEGGANVQGGYSQPVLSFPDDAAWSGCRDMAGNVAEWTSTPVSPLPLPEGPYFGDLMFVCGGSFVRSQPLNDAEQCFFEMRRADVGFRCVLPVLPTPEAVAALTSGEP